MCAQLAIGQAHAAAWLSRPERTEQVRELERSMARERIARKKRALLHEHIAQNAKTLQPTTLGDRERALLMLGFWGAFRASKLVALRIEDAQALPPQRSSPSVSSALSRPPAPG